MIQEFLSKIETVETEDLKIILKQVVAELHSRDLQDFIKELQISSTGTHNANKKIAERDVKAQIAAAERKASEEAAAAKQQELWEAKRLQAEELKAVLTDDNDNIYFQVWKSGSGEKRVYVQNGEPFGKRTVNIACLYVTGNSKNKANSLSVDSSKRVIDEDALKIILGKIAAKWESTKVSVNEALK